MNAVYTEFKCPSCGESWVLQMSNYSEEANQMLKDEFNSHVQVCLGDEDDQLKRSIIEITNSLSRLNHASI